MISEVFTKLANNTVLTPEERLELLGFINSLNTETKLPPTRLSEISWNAGDLIAGRFIAPAPASTSTEPTETAFTGSFMSGKGETFSSTAYNVGGVSAGVLQWGASQTDGKLKAGAGAVTLDADGVTVTCGTNDVNKIKLKAASGVVGSLYATAPTDVSLNADGNATQPGAGILLNATAYPGSGNAAISLNAYDNAFSSYITLSLKSQEKTLTLYNGTDLYNQLSQVAGTPNILNETGADIDTRIEGDTDANLTVWDAGLNAIGMGGAADGSYKLKVTGDVNITGDYYRDGVKLGCVTYLPVSAYTTLGSGLSANVTTHSASIDDTITFVSWAQAVFVLTTNSASHYWTITLQKLDGTVINTMTTASINPDTWSLLTDSTWTVGSVGTADKGVYISVTKTGSPGNLYILNPAIKVTF